MNQRRFDRDRDDFDRDFDRMGTWFWRFFTAVAVFIVVCLVATIAGLILVGPTVFAILQRLAAGGQ